MNVKYVSPFAEAAIGVFNGLIGETPTRGQLRALPSMCTGQQINILCGVTGNIEGLVVFGMSVITADKIASKMIGQPVVTFDAMASSAVAELGNMITAHAATALAELGYSCDITPPTIIKGSQVAVSSSSQPALVIPLDFAELGSFEISVCLNEPTASLAA